MFRFKILLIQQYTFNTEAISPEFVLLKNGNKNLHVSQIQTSLV
jgi:hypothetical protein